MAFAEIEARLFARSGLHEPFQHPTRLRRAPFDLVPRALRPAGPDEVAPPPHPAELLAGAFRRRADGRRLDPDMDPPPLPFRSRLTHAGDPVLAERFPLLRRELALHGCLVLDPVGLLRAALREGAQPGVVAVDLPASRGVGLRAVSFQPDGLEDAPSELGERQRVVRVRNRLLRRRGGSRSGREDGEDGGRAKDPFLRAAGSAENAHHNPSRRSALPCRIFLRSSVENGIRSIQSVPSLFTTKG